MPVCSRFIDALEGKADLVTVFSEVVQQNCSHHVSPSECVKQWYVKVQRSNKVEWTEEDLEWVRLYLTTFGWHNCANKLTIRTTNSKRQEQLALGLNNNSAACSKSPQIVTKAEAITQGPSSISITRPETPMANGESNN